MSFQFTNETAKTVYVTFQWYSPDTCAGYGNWETRGWWGLYPGETKTVYGANLLFVNRTFYFYAESYDRTMIWSGPFSTCTPITAFDWCLDICNTNPLTRILGYREIQAPFVVTHTIRLVA